MRGIENAAGWVCLLVLTTGCGTSSGSDERAGGGASVAAGASGGAPAGAGGAGGSAVSAGGASTDGGSSTTGGSANAGSGGTQPNGGSGGSVVKPPQTVLDCNGLAAPGVWENITPPDHNADYRSADFVVDPVNSGVVYVGTDSTDDGNSKGVLKTTDCGATWVHISTGEGSDAVDGGRQWTFRIDFVDSNVLYTNSGYYDLGLWKSTNGGVDWFDVTAENGGPPGFVGNLQMDPLDPQHLLQSWHATCNGPNGEYDPPDDVGCIHESTDGGATWTAHYASPNWQSQVRPLMLHGDTWLVLASDVMRTTDGGQSFDMVYEGGLGGHSAGTISYALNGDYYVGSEQGIYRSLAASDGVEWTKVQQAQWVGEIADTGTTLFASQQTNRFMTSTDGGNTWELLPDGPTGCERVKYDSGHGLIYASCGDKGFHRVVAE
jgi:hypothetical protein